MHEREFTFEGLSLNNSHRKKVDLNKTKDSQQQQNCGKTVIRVLAFKNFSYLSTIKKTLFIFRLLYRSHINFVFYVAYRYLTNVMPNATYVSTNCIP